MCVVRREGDCMCASVTCGKKNRVGTAERENEASLGHKGGMGVAEGAWVSLYCLSLGPQCRRRED